MLERLIDARVSMPALLNINTKPDRGGDLILLPDLRKTRRGSDNAAKESHPHPELPIKYTEIDKTLNRFVNLDSVIWLSSAETTPGPNITSAIRRRAEEIAHETGIKERPVITVLTGVHTDIEPGLVNKGEKGPIQLKCLFAGADVRKMGQDPNTPCVVSMRDRDGSLTRLESMPQKLWTREIKPDIVIASVSSLKDNFYSLGTDAEMTAELINTLRDERRNDGQTSTRLILVENQNIPSTNGDTMVHYLEADAVVIDDRAIPEHKAVEKPEAKLTADVLVNAAIQKLKDPLYAERPIKMQCGIGEGPGNVPEPLAQFCRKSGVEAGIYSEVVGSYVTQLLDNGLIDGKIVASFALGISSDLKTRPHAYEIRRTSAVNNVDAIRSHLEEEHLRINRKREADGLEPHEKQPMFIAVNWGTQIDLASGDVIAAQVPVYDENGKVKGYKIQAGHGGQKVMMEAGSKLGFSMIGIQAQREINGKKVPAFVFDREGAETTTPADFVSIYATKYGFYERQQLTGDPEQDQKIKQENIRGLIGICAPEDREELTRQAIEKGLLPRREFTVYENPNPMLAPYLMGMQAGFILARQMLEASRSVYFPTFQHRA